MHACILSKLSRNHPLGVGDSKFFKWYMYVDPMGAQGESPKGQNHANFKITSSPDPEVEQSSYVVFRYLLTMYVKN